MHGDVPVDDDFDQRAWEFNVPRISNRHGWKLAVGRCIDASGQCSSFRQIRDKIVAAAEGKGIAIGQQPSLNEVRDFFCAL